VESVEALLISSIRISIASQFIVRFESFGLPQQYDSPSLKLHFDRSVESLAFKNIEQIWYIKVRHHSSLIPAP
jgi:hypothetical protein